MKRFIRIVVWLTILFTTELYQIGSEPVILMEALLDFVICYIVYGFVCKRNLMPSIFNASFALLGTWTDINVDNPEVRFLIPQITIVFFILVTIYVIRYIK